MQEKIKDFLRHPYLEEVLIDEDFINLFKRVEKIRHYIGFEISGKLHIGSGIITLEVIKQLQDLGVETTIFLADWHSWINNKLGGDIDFIRKVAISYVKEVFVACAKVVKADPSKIRFVLGNDLYQENHSHWATFMQVGMHTTLARIKRSISIMGRKQGESVTFAQLCYPPLQVADIFTLQVHIAHAGMDQRKAHVIAREVAEHITINPLKDKNGKIIKPVAVHQRLVPSLLAPSKWPLSEDEAKKLLRSGDMKMSKSKPEGAIFVLDSPDDIRRKIHGAFAPEGDLTYNPLAVWVKMFVFDRNQEFFIKRDKRFGGNITIRSWEEFVDIYEAKALHPLDVKNAFAEYLIEFLAPAREYVGGLRGDFARIEQELSQRITR